MNSILKFKKILQTFAVFIISGILIANNEPTQNFEELQQQAIDQADEIDLIVELLAEAANKEKFNSNNKTDSLLKFDNIRYAISSTKDTNNLPKLLRTNDIIIKGLEIMASNNFTIVPAINNNIVLRRSPPQVTSEEAQEKLELQKEKLSNLQKAFKNLGLSTLNKATRRLEKIITKSNIHKAIYRLTPYTLIMLYILYITHDDNLKQSSSFLYRALNNTASSIKELIGIPTPLIKDNIVVPKTTDGNQNTTKQIVSDPQETLIKFEIQPLIKWAPATFLLSLIKNDWNDLTKKVRKWSNSLCSKLKKEKPPSTSVFSKPSLSADSLNLFELLEFKSVKNYFKYKRLFNLANHKIDKSYLLVGPTKTGYYMADIFCAQLAKDLNSNCGITALNASDFVPPKRLDKSKFDKKDKLPKILADAKKNDVAIVIIKNIDWIYHQSERTIARLDTFLDNISKKTNTILIALTDKIDKVDDSAKNKLVTIEINNLSYEQRVQFIKAQLRADHAAKELGIEEIAKQTENYSLAELKKIVDDAYTLSYAEHKPFNKIHLTQAIAKIAAIRK